MPMFMIHADGIWNIKCKKNSGRAVERNTVEERKLQMCFCT